MKIFSIGHRSPDTDSVVSAVIASDYFNKKKIKVIPGVIGNINKETKLVFHRFKQEIPKSLNKAKKNEKYFLIDHGGLEQSLPELKESDILGVIDHHQMFGLKTIEPIFYRCEPIGSTSTLLAKMFFENGWKLNKTQSSLLIAAIVSDTLNLTSKTTTFDDKKIVNQLNEVACLDIKSLALDMFKAKSDISGMSLEKIVSGDYKVYDFQNKNIGIGVFETVSVTHFENKRSKIIEEIKNLKKNKKADLCFFAVVDIFKNKTYLYYPGEEEKIIIQKAFGVKIKEEGLFILPGVTSRKKEIMPPLFKAI